VSKNSRLWTRLEALESIQPPPPEPTIEPQDRQAWQALCGDPAGRQLVREFAMAIDSVGWPPSSLVRRIDGRLEALGFGEQFSGGLRGKHGSAA